MHSILGGIILFTLGRKLTNHITKDLKNLDENEIRKRAVPGYGVMGFLMENCGSVLILWGIIKIAV